MSPDSSELEAFFVADDAPHAGAGRGGPNGGELDKFGQFFDKLAGIDDAPWFTDDGEAAPIHRRAVKAMHVKVVHNRPQAISRHPAGPPTAPAADRSVEMNSGPVASEDDGEEGPGMGERFRTGLLVLGLGSLLFALGLGVGAVVLSLPAKTKPTAEGPVSQKMSVPKAAPAPADAVANPEHEPITRGPARTVTEKSESWEESGSAANDASTVSLPAYGSAEDLPGARANTAGASAKPAGGEKTFALQVGACGSHECVERYRELLLTHVKSTEFRVVMAKAGNGESIQRIRVEPLTREQAEALKAKLSAMDKRFDQAYTIALR